MPPRGAGRRGPAREENLIRRKLLVGAVVLLAVIGTWEMGHGAWIRVKARLAQYLLQRAWAQTRRGDRDVKPWP